MGSSAGRELGSNVGGGLAIIMGKGLGGSMGPGVGMGVDAGVGGSIGGGPDGSTHRVSCSSTDPEVGKIGPKEASSAIYHWTAAQVREHKAALTWEFRSRGG